MKHDHIQMCCCVANNWPCKQSVANGIIVENRFITSCKNNSTTWHMEPNLCRMHWSCRNHTYHGIRKEIWCKDSKKSLRTAKMVDMLSEDRWQTWTSPAASPRMSSSKAKWPCCRIRICNATWAGEIESKKELSTETDSRFGGVMDGEHHPFLKQEVDMREGSKYSRWKRRD